MAKAINRAIDLQKQIYGESKARYAPYENMGSRALPKWENLVNEIPDIPDIIGFAQQFGKDANALRQTPGYQFTVGEGERQLDRIAGQTGYRRSGNRLIEALKYGQRLGDTLYNQEYARGLNSLLADYNLRQGRFGTRANLLGSQVGMGLNATSALSGLSTNYANTLSNLFQQYGQTQAIQAAAPYAGYQDIIRNTINGIASYFGAGQNLGQAPGSGYTNSLGSSTYQVGGSTYPSLGSDFVTSDLQGLGGSGGGYGGGSNFLSGAF